MWLWKQYQVYRGYTPPTEDEEAVKYRIQLEDIAEAEAQIDKELERASQTLLQLRKKEKKLLKNFKKCADTLQVLSREDVQLTEEQKTAKANIEQLIEQELNPTVEKTQQKIADLEYKVRVLNEKRNGLRITQEGMEEYLGKRDGQFPLHNINVVGGSETSAPTRDDEVYIPQDTPVIQMTDASLEERVHTIGSSVSTTDVYITPQRVMADPL